VTAAGFYSYWGFYTFAILPVWLMFQHARKTPIGKRKLLAFLFMLLAFSMPLVLESLEADVFYRVRTLSVFHTTRHPGNTLLQDYGAGLQHIALNFLSTLGMLVWTGSHDWKHNYHSAPELSLIAAVGFAMSCCYAISIWRRTRRGEYKPVTTYALRVLFVWVILAMLPGVLTDEGVPHASRTLGMVVPLQMLAGLGWSYIGQALVSSRFARSGRRYVGVMCMAAFMMVQVYDLTYTYFVLYAKAPETIRAFTANVTWCKTYSFCH
jgi:hypothetical protein